MKTEKEMKALADKSFKEHQEYLSKLTPEEREQYLYDGQETKEKLNHCIDEEGISHPSQINIEEFLYLKNIKETDHLNKILIRTLAHYSNMNILLRYLLIEAALNNEKIEAILKETVCMGGQKFYNIPNNVKEFNNKSVGYVVENRQNPTSLEYWLFKYGISTPEEASRRKIQQKTNKIIDEEILNVMKDFSKSFSEEIHEMFDLKNKTTMTVDRLLYDIAFILKSFVKSDIENQFSNKHTQYKDGYILFLNEMYWFNEKSFRSLLNSYLYFPNLLMSLTQNTKNTLSSVIKVTQEEKAKWEPKIKINIRSLPQKTKEKLQSKIVKRIEILLDEGVTQEQAFYKLSKESIKELGYDLTKGQIEGQYKRHQDEVNKI